MNHDSLKQGLFMSVMNVLNNLVHEYKNEKKAKRELLNIVNNIFLDLSIQNNLEDSIKTLMALYKKETDHVKRKEIYTKLSVLNDALKIMEQTNNA
jgi:hypothetical protein